MTVCLAMMTVCLAMMTVCLAMMTLCLAIRDPITKDKKAIGSIITY
jgi:hypothetical protein